MGSIARTIGYADTTAPTAPTLSLTAQGTDALLASWTPATDTGTGVRYYRLYVGTTAGTLALTETFSRATTAWLISGLPAQSTRHARVDAVDGAGNVSSSAVVSGTTQAQGTGGALAFAQPNPVSYSPGQTVSLALSQYVTGGGATKFYHRMSGSLPGDLSLATATGAITGTARQSGPYAPVIRVTDTTADALESDWVARSTAPGVKWAHDFRADAEVTAYTVGPTQYDETGTVLRCRRSTADFITGTGCLELYTPAGAHNNMTWYRPFSAFPGDVGYVSGAALPSNFTTNYNQYRRDIYGHSSYHVDDPSVGLVLPGGARDGLTWVGTEFYAQFRVKISADAFSASHPANYSGKLAVFDLAGSSNQELVLQGPADATRRFDMYTNFGANTPPYNQGTELNALQSNTAPAGTPMQPGGAYADGCRIGSTAGCWLYPTDQWVTILVHVVPGRNNGDSASADMTSTSNYRDTRIEVWAATYGQTEYELIWSKGDYVWNYYANATYGQAFGFNVLWLTQYMNGDRAGVAWWRRYTQVIFGTRFIECPKVYA